MRLRAEYDTEAHALAINLSGRESRADASEAVHDRARVALLGGAPVDVEVLDPDRGIEDPLAAAAARYSLDLEALIAAARSALAAPNRAVTLEVEAPTPV